MLLNIVNLLLFRDVMKARVFYIILLFLSTLTVLSSQEVVNMPERTPEQEASSQTDRLQKELNLSAEQLKDVYEINLHYARQRQHSNSRAEATQRIKNKNEDLKQVLTLEQYEKLQNKHYTRSNYSGTENTSSKSSYPDFSNEVKPASGDIKKGSPVNRPLSSSAHRSSKEERERKDEERANSRAYYYTTPPKAAEKEYEAIEATPLNRNGEYNNSVRSTERSTSSAYQQRMNTTQPSSGNRSSSGNVSPSRNSGSNSSSGTRSSGSSNSNRSSSSESTNRRTQ